MPRRAAKKKNGSTSLKTNPNGEDVRKFLTDAQRLEVQVLCNQIARMEQDFCQHRIDYIAREKELMQFILVSKRNLMERTALLAQEHKVDMSQGDMQLLPETGEFVPK